MTEVVPTRHALPPLQVKVRSPAARSVLLNFTLMQRKDLFTFILGAGQCKEELKNSSLKFLLKSFMERFGLTCVLKCDVCETMGEEASSGVDFLLNTQLESSVH